MAISFVSNALGGTTTTTSFSITLPTTQAGDILILEFAHRGTGDGTIAGTSVSTGGLTWALKRDQPFNSSTFSGKTYWTRATGDHSGQTVTGASLTNSCAAIVTIYRGAVTSGDPLADATIVGEENASGNETQAEITTTTNGAWVVLVVANSPDVAVASQACTSPGTLAERAERLSTGGTDTSIVHASEEKATAGATGAFTWSQSNGASGSWAYAIKPFVDSPPTVTLNSPADTATVVDTTPTLDFTGTDVDIVSTGVVDSYSESNHSVNQPLAGTSTTIKVGQSFTGDGKVLSSAQFYLAKQSSGAGDVTVSIYAHTGTFGSGGTGTGSALATSDAIDASTFSTTIALISFTFSGANKIRLVNGTKYVVVVEKAAGALNTGVNVGQDDTSPSHAGNFVFFTSSWGAQTTRDTIFYVNGDVMDDIRYNIQIDTVDTFNGQLSTPTVDNTSNAGAGSGDPGAWNHTVTSGNLLIVAIGYHANNLNGVTYNGDAMTKIDDASIVGGGTNFTKLDFYYLINPDAGTNQVSADFNVPTQYVGMGISVIGADTSNPIDFADAKISTHATGDTIDATTSIDDNLLIDFAMVKFGGFRTNGPDPDGSTVIIADQASGGGGTVYGGAGYKVATSSGANTMAQTWTVSFGTPEFAHGVVSINGISEPLLDKVSGTDTGFVNEDNGGDTDPFTSGDLISYTVQAGEELDADTYYWRVRGIDPSGSNTYGAWSSTRSFIIEEEATRRIFLIS